MLTTGLWPGRGDDRFARLQSLYISSPAHTEGESRGGVVRQGAKRRTGEAGSKYLSCPRVCEARRRTGYPAKVTRYVHPLRRHRASRCRATAVPKLLDAQVADAVSTTETHEAEILDGHPCIKCVTMPQTMLRFAHCYLLRRLRILLFA